MPKYGDIIKQAKSGKPDDQTDGIPEDQQARQPDNQTDENQSVKQEKPENNQAPIKPDNQIDRKPDEPMKNLCVKVPESWRRHWAAQAKLTGRTMTEVMVEALTEEFGLPEDQKTK